MLNSLNITPCRSSRIAGSLSRFAVIWWIVQKVFAIGRLDLLASQVLFVIRSALSGATVSLQTENSPPKNSNAYLGSFLSDAHARPGLRWTQNRPETQADRTSSVHESSQVLHAGLSLAAVPKAEVPAEGVCLVFDDRAGSLPRVPAAACPPSGAQPRRQTVLQPVYWSLAATKSNLWYITLHHNHAG